MQSDRDEFWLKGLLGIADNRTTHAEKLISALGALLGIMCVYLISQWYLGPQESLLLVASMGATAVLLFAVPHGALSQPWAVLGGHGVSAVIGVSCQYLLPDNLLAPALAVALSILAMHYMRCIHPPGGATALSAVIGGEAIHSLGYLYLFTPVLLNLLCMLVVAVVFNGCFPWRRYPAVWARRTKPEDSPAAASHSSGLSHEDLAAAMEKMNSYIDVTSEELAELFDLAVEHALQAQQSSQQLSVGDYYSNGQLGTRWAVRQILDGPERLASARDRLVFKTVAGSGCYETGSCTLAEFRQWARFPVDFTGERWVRRHQPSE